MPSSAKRYDTNLFPANCCSQLYNQRSHDTWEHSAGATITNLPTNSGRDRESHYHTNHFMYEEIILRGEVIVFHITDIFSFDGVY